MQHRAVMCMIAVSDNPVKLRMPKWPLDNVLARREKSRPALGQLALCSAGWSALDSLTTCHLLLPFGDIMQHL